MNVSPSPGTLCIAENFTNAVQVTTLSAYMHWDKISIKFVANESKWQKHAIDIKFYYNYALPNTRYMYATTERLSHKIKE